MDLNKLLNPSGAPEQPPAQNHHQAHPADGRHSPVLAAVQMGRVATPPLGGLRDGGLMWPLPPTSPISRHSSPTMSTAALPGKRHYARAIGQAYRDRQRDSVEALQEEVRLLKLDENALLYEHGALLAQATHAMRACQEVEAAVYGGRVGHRLSNDLATCLAVPRLTGAMALVLLELIQGRRNLPYPGSRPNARIECDEPMFDNILTEDARVLQNVFGHSCELLRFVLCGVLRKVHANWCEHEDDVYMLFSTAPRQLMSFGRKLPISKPKACKHCGRLRVAGSGHPRSGCDQMKTTEEDEARCSEPDKPPAFNP